MPVISSHIIGNDLILTVSYDEATLRVTQASWSLARACTATLKVWRDGVLMIDRTVNGPHTGTYAFGINITLSEVVENGITELRFPDNIVYKASLKKN